MLFISCDRRLFIMEFFLQGPHLWQTRSLLMFFLLFLTNYGSFHRFTFQSQQENTFISVLLPALKIRSDFWILLSAKYVTARGKCTEGLAVEYIMYGKTERKGLNVFPVLASKYNLFFILVSRFFACTVNCWIKACSSQFEKLRLSFHLVRTMWFRVRFTCSRTYLWNTSLIYTTGRKVTNNRIRLLIYYSFSLQ